MYNYLTAQTNEWWLIGIFATIQLCANGWPLAHLKMLTAMSHLKKYIYTYIYIYIIWFGINKPSRVDIS